jgi:transcriptional regulator with XRE-family HTH domain
MFEPLPSLVRLQRERRGLTQDRLAKLAKVSRGQLIAFERGDQNISLLFLLKIAKALELTELRIGDLYLHPSPPDVTTLIKAADAIATAERIVRQAASEADELEKAKASVSALMERVLGPVPDAGIGSAAERLAASQAPKGAAKAAAKAVAKTGAGKRVRKAS